MALMNDVLRPFLRKCIIVFLDDISLRSFAVSEEKRLETRRRIALPRGKRLNASVHHVVLCHTVVSYCNWRRQQMTSRVCPGWTYQVSKWRQVSVRWSLQWKSILNARARESQRQLFCQWLSFVVASTPGTQLLILLQWLLSGTPLSLSSKSQGPIVPLRLWHLLSDCLAVSLSVCIETSNLKQHC